MENQPQSPPSSAQASPQDVTMETSTPTVEGASEGNTSQSKRKCPKGPFGPKHGHFNHRGWFGYGSPHHPWFGYGEPGGQCSNGNDGKEDESSKKGTEDNMRTGPQCPMKGSGFRSWRSHNWGNPGYGPNAFNGRHHGFGHPYWHTEKDSQGHEKPQTSDDNDSEDDGKCPMGPLGPHRFMGPPRFGPGSHRPAPCSDPHHWAMLAHLHAMYEGMEGSSGPGAYSGPVGPHWGFGGRWAHAGPAGRCGPPHWPGMMGAPRRKVITIVEACDPFLGLF